MFAAFPIVLFIIGAILLVGLPIGLSVLSYFRNRGRRPVICPDNHELMTVELDNKLAFSIPLRGEEHEGLQSCTRWPEKATAVRNAWRRSILSPKTLSVLCRSGTRARPVPFAVVRLLLPTADAAASQC